LGNAYKMLVAKPKRHRHDRVDNNKYAPYKIRWEGVDSKRLAKNRVYWQALVNMVMNLKVS
jgi:hypothetical protein